MSDKPNDSQVPMNNAAVKQKHRMAAGLPVDGKTLPSPPPAGPKTPC